MRSLKLCFCLAWIISVIGLWSGGPMSKAKESDADKPEAKLIDEFDGAIQQRFLREPEFGVSRIAPLNPHLRGYTPTTKEEKDIVTALQKGEWNVGLYLYGRRAVPKSIANPKEFEFIYLNNPAIPVTQRLEKKQLNEPQELLKEVKVAFDSFANQNSYEFKQEKWSYVARPVRARQSCIECHTDFGLTEKDGKENYIYRPKVGDTIGVLVYAFAKSKNQFAATK